MNPSDEERDALTDEYRRASAAEAGRPAATVRKAILAEAAAAANRRTPASNDSRYLWRGIAGVAVLGFAILMWKQVDHRLPGEASVVAARSEAPGQVLLETPAPAAAAESKPALIKEARAPRPTPAVSQPPAAPPLVVADRAADATPAGMALAAQAESSAKAAVSREVANAMQGVPAPAPAARALGKMSAAQDAEVDADALLRLHFPQQYQSSAPHSVWLVQDATGAVVRSGELAAGKTFGDIRLEIERELGGTLLRPWRIRSLQNARGQIIQIGIAQTR